jgi:aspartyl protease family protein
MMTNDMMLGGVYLLMAIMLVAGSLMTRREPAMRMVTMALAWIAIFGAGFVLFTFRDNFGWVTQRLKSEALGTPVQEGKQTRIPMAIDGHFWVDATLNGQKVKFLVDSGATTTTVGRDIARKSGVTISAQRDRYVRTGNGIILVATGRARELKVGDIVRRDLAIEIADGDNLNVLGMNYLSTLTRWGVEGRWLILEP